MRSRLGAANCVVAAVRELIGVLEIPIPLDWIRMKKKFQQQCITYIRFEGYVAECLTCLCRPNAALFSSISDCKDKGSISIKMIVSTDKGKQWSQLIHKESHCFNCKHTCLVLDSARYHMKCRYQTIYVTIYLRWRIFSKQKELFLPNEYNFTPCEPWWAKRA
jgi:hypothetical protein